MPANTDQHRPGVLYADRPFIAIWEVTRACDLACVHCRAEAEAGPYPDELDTKQALDLIRQVSEWKVPLFVMTGGDPLKRGDLTTLVKECSRRGMNFALAPSVTPLLTLDRLKELKDAGIHRISISLDGADAETHDRFRQVPGTFARCLEVMKQIRDLDIRLQVNTTISMHNYIQTEDIAQLIRQFTPDLWSVFFLVPTGRAKKDQALHAAETESVLQVLYDTLCENWFDIKTTEAPQFRRIILQRQRVAPDRLEDALEHRSNSGLLRAARGVNDGRGFVFISHTGEVCPSGFLPMPGGNVKDQPLAEIYQKSPIFQKLRDSDLLLDKCGRCEYRYLCGGSRARGYAMTGDIMGGDPFCPYQPGEFINKP